MHRNNIPEVNGRCDAPQAEADLNQGQEPTKVSWLEKVGWMELGTMLLALCAVVTSLWQGYSMQQHNQLSLRPYLQFETNALPQPDNLWAFEIRLRNNGLGPADVNKVQLWLDGQPVSSTNIFWQQYGVAQQSACYGSGNVGRFYKVDDNQLVISAQEAPCLLTQQQFEQIFRRLTIQIDYQSLYGEQFQALFGSTNP